MRAVVQRVSEASVTINGNEHARIRHGLLVLLGIAIGAFHWTASPWFIGIKQFLATWLIDRDITWPLETDNVPWFLFTHYPEQNDVFSWLDGTMVIAYILVTGLVYGTVLLALMAGATRVLGRFSMTRLHHLAQALIPIAGAGVFLGLSATTLSLLRAEHVPLFWASDVRLTILAIANLWSAWLAWLVTRRYSARLFQRGFAMLWFIAALAVVDSAWWLMFWGWAR